MKVDDFRKMSVQEAKIHVEKHGLKVLIKKSGEFYDEFFGWWRPDSKEKLKILIDNGLNINLAVCESWREKKAPIFRVLSDPDGETASIIKALVECGADVNLPNDDGQTPIMVASTGRYVGDLSKPSVVKALIKAGADLSLQDSKGNLVTDLADHKALPALVAAGAPINSRKSHALWTAVWGKDLELTKDLLLKGLKKGLSSWELQVRLPFFETIAQTSPDLFQKGFSLKDTEAQPADKKTVKAFKALLDMCSAEPKNNPANTIDASALPPSLRSGAWPPPKPEAATYLQMPSVATDDPQFRFPNDIKKPYDERFAKIDGLLRNKIAFSNLMNDIDTCLNRIEKYEILEFSKKFKLEISERQYVGVFIRGLGLIDPYNDRISACMIKIKSVSSIFSNFCAISQCRFDSVYDATAVTSFSKRDLESFRSLPSKRDFIRYAIKHGGYQIFEFEAGLGIFGKRTFISCYENNKIAYGNEFRDFVRTLIQFEEFLNDALDLPMLYKFANLSSDYVKYHCNKYFSSSLSRNDRDSLIDLIETDIGSDATEFLIAQAKSGSSAALWSLSFLDSPNIARFMLENLSQGHNAKFALAWLDRFPATAAQGLLQCAFGSNIADRSLAQAALRLMSFRGKSQLTIECALKFGAGAQAIAIEFLAQDSRADFLPKKMPKLPAYFIASIHPAPILKSTGEALPAYAVATLVRMMLVSTCHLQNSALKDVIEACDPRSLADFALSTFELWSRNGAKNVDIGFLYALAYLGDDRAAAMLFKAYRNAPPTAVAPVLDVLACMASNTAIAGLQAIARSSQKEDSRELAEQVLEDVARDRGLTPEMLEDLAVPDLGLDQDSRMTLDFGPRHFLVSLDANLDAVLFDEGGNILKALPKPVKAGDANKAKAATAQWKEFKAALKGQAAGQKKRFEQAMLSRREWDGATFKEVIVVHPLLSKMVRSLVWATLRDQVLETTFRIDAAGRCVAADGQELSLDNEARVTLPHPLLLGDKVETWLQIFAENKLTQPFPQLARKWFAEGPETEKLISNKDGTKVPLGALRGLKAKGWEFEEGGAGMVWSVYKSDEGARASIEVEPGWSLSGFDYEDFGGDQTVKLDVSGSDPIAYSELVRDFLSLPVATGEEP